MGRLVNIEGIREDELEGGFGQTYSNEYIKLSIQKKECLMHFGSITSLQPLPESICYKTYEFQKTKLVWGGGGSGDSFLTGFSSKLQFSYFSVINIYQYNNCDPDFSTLKVISWKLLLHNSSVESFYLQFLPVSISCRREAVV